MAALWQALFANIALIATILLFWGIIADLATKQSEQARATLFGLILGAGAVASMASAQEIVSGVYFDLRTPLVSAAALFGGAAAGVLSAAVALIYRAYLGGQGALAGSLGILTAMACGLLANRLLREGRLPTRGLLGFAAITPVVSLSSLVLLPTVVREQVLDDAALPVTILSFFATLLIVAALERERKRWELLRKNLIFSSMVEKLPDCLNVKDEQGRFLAANPATAWLMRAGSPENLIGKTDFDFYPVELAEQFRKDEVQVLKDGEPRAFDQEVIFPDDRPGWLLTLKAPLRDESGAILGLITHNRDITEQRIATQIKNEFVSTVSHELRTPLTAIRGSLGLVASGVAGPLPDMARNLVRIAHSNSERLVLLINDILDMEKIESGKMDFEMVDHAVRSLVEQAISSMANYEADKEVQLVLQDKAPDAAALLDGDRFLQIMTNLLSNAIKYSPPFGEVTISIHREKNVLKVSVEDQGEGIPEEFHDRIFGKFEQADSSSTRVKGGTGLGLSITKAIVERMSGKISFETKLGYGTKFIVEFPDRTLPASLGDVAANA
jgi:PAS domain S-box-containing protein